MCHSWLYTKQRDLNCYDSWFVEQRWLSNGQSTCSQGWLCSSTVNDVVDGSIANVILQFCRFSRWFSSIVENILYCWQGAMEGNYSFWTFFGWIITIRQIVYYRYMLPCLLPLDNTRRLPVLETLNSRPFYGSWDFSIWDSVVTFWRSSQSCLPSSFIIIPTLLVCFFHIVNFFVNKLMIGQNLEWLSW